jgi:hypothetical protein
MIRHPSPTTQLATRRTSEAFQGVEKIPGSTERTTEFGHAASTYGTTDFPKTHVVLGGCSALQCWARRSSPAVELLLRCGPTPTWTLLPLLLGDCPIDRGE